MAEMGGYCNICNFFLEASSSFLSHINSREHQRTLIRGILEYYSLNSTSNHYKKNLRRIELVLVTKKYQNRLNELEKEEKEKAYKREKRREKKERKREKERKRKAEEDLYFAADEEVAAVMGFSKFGSSKKPH
ncbi:zinc finger matrin-type protein 2-like [Tachysurus fulvidraco]|uniref:zinc finger matrin-type protein 2-like n=1 Tax=Tachysurus fulvidraco TaxID=1234273 RepID=UPI001FEFB1F8|nr:zinc finger matrin-type protein 2-like [Tachysurus fulvidraco]